MTRVEDFGNHLFSLLAKDLLFRENAGSSEEKPDTLEKNLDSAAENLEYSESKDISRSVFMLSYVYRIAFTTYFSVVHSILIRAEENPITYVRCFAEVLYQKYSPLKFLIVCSFISEIFLFLSNVDDSKRKHYVQHTTEALKDVFHRIFEKDFPKNGWTDIQNVASKIAKGFQYLKPFLDGENSRLKAIEVAHKLLNHEYEDENECQQVDNALSGGQQEMASVNIPSDPSSQVLVNIPSDQSSQVLANIPSDPSSQVLVNISAIEVPILSSDGLPTNQNAYLVTSGNLMYSPVYPISFGTIDQDPQLSKLLQFSGYRTEAVTFQNPPSGTEPNFHKVVQPVAEFSNTESRAQENLTAKSFEDGPEPSFQTDKKIEKETESIADNTIISVQETMDAEKRDYLSKTVSKKNDPGSETFSTDHVSDPQNELLLKKGDAYDPENATFSNPESETFSKGDSYGGSPTESSALSTDENVSDPEKEKISNEEDTRAILKMRYF